MRTSYYICSELPEIFKIADREVAKRYPRETEYIHIPPRIKEPIIDSNPNITGPIKITKEWYIKEKRKQEIKWMKEERRCETEMIKLMSKRDYLRYQLGKLDPSKRKDANKIAKINIELKIISSELDLLEMESGVKCSELDHGTGFGRAVGRIKETVRKFTKKVKKFVRNNRELVAGAISLLIPVVSKIIVGLASD